MLITGANGFIGRRLVVALSNMDGYAVTATFRHSNDFLPAPTKSLTLRSLDIDSKSEIDSLFRAGGFDVVINAAAALPPIDRVTGLAAALCTNVAAQVNLVSRAIASGCRRYIYYSTISVYEGLSNYDGGWNEDAPISPTEPYGLTKSFGEQVLQSMVTEQSDMSGISLRLAGVHGPGKNGGVVSHLLRAAMVNEPLKISEPNSRFRLLFVDDAVAATLRALDIHLDHAYRCYNVAGKETTSLRDLAEVIRKVAGSSSNIVEGDQSIVRDQIMNIARAEAELGYVPSSLAERLDQFRSEIQNQKSSTA